MAPRVQDIPRTLGSQTIGMTIQTVASGHRSSRRHRHVFQEEILIVMCGTGDLLLGDSRIAVGPGTCVNYRPDDPAPHCFESTGAEDLVIWAFGNRFAHEVCLYPDEGIAFGEGLGADAPLSEAVAISWTEDRRQR